MSEKQRTLKGIVKLRGIGLHTGVEANLEIHPAPANHGYKFQRVDLGRRKPIINADCRHGCSQQKEERHSSKTMDGRVYTTEHVLAAIVRLSGR